MLERKELKRIFLVRHCAGEFEIMHTSENTIYGLILKSSRHQLSFMTESSSYRGTCI